LRLARDGTGELRVEAEVQALPLGSRCRPMKREPGKRQVARMDPWVDVGGVMIRIPLSDPVEYLVSRKFSYSPLIPKMEGPGRGRFKDEQELITEIEAYRSELRAMPPEEFQTLCEQEQEGFLGGVIELFHLRQVRKRAQDRVVFARELSIALICTRWSLA
jgi:hypothetical protein